jgi:hypothetical protein
MHLRRHVAERGDLAVTITLPMRDHGRNAVVLDGLAHALDRPLCHVGAVSGAARKGIAVHSVRIIPHFVQQKSKRSPAVRRAHGTVSILLRSIGWRQIGHGRVQSNVAIWSDDIRAPRCPPQLSDRYTMTVDGATRVDPRPQCRASGR